MDPTEETAAYRREAALRPECGCDAGWSVVTRDGARVGVCGTCGAEAQREPDECDGLGGTCGLARGHTEPCRTCFVDSTSAPRETVTIRPRVIVHRETFREVPPASPLAALKGAVGRLEAAVGEPQPPTPAEMLNVAWGNLCVTSAILRAMGRIDLAEELDAFRKRMAGDLRVADAEEESHG